MAEKNNESVEINLAYLEEVSSGSIEFMVDMIDVFLSQTPAYFDQLSEAVAKSDWKAAGDLAHKIKPTFAFMGAESARQAMEGIEKKARNLESVETIKGDLEIVQNKTRGIYTRLEELKKELELKLR